MKLFGVEMYSGPEHAAYALAIYAFAELGSIIIAGTPDQVLAAAIPIAHYWGREQMNAESKIGKIGKPMFPWQWHSKSQWDFYVPTAVVSLAALASHFMR